MTPEEFISIWQNVEPPKPIFYRLYYNENGLPICYTMEDLPGKYIDIDQETYALADYSVRVVDEKLIKIVPKRTVQKLSPMSAVTMNGFTNPVAGQSVTIIIYGGTSYTSITSTMKFAGGDKTLTGTSGCIDIVSIFYDGTTYFASINKGFA